jgi:hypothetical protein
MKSLRYPLRKSGRKAFWRESGDLPVYAKCNVKASGARPNRVIIK